MRATGVLAAETPRPFIRTCVSAVAAVAVAARCCLRCLFSTVWGAPGALPTAGEAQSGTMFEFLHSQQQQFLALRNWTAVMYVSCVDKRGASRLLKLLNPFLTYLSCVPQPQRHNGRVFAWLSRVVVSYVGGDDNQSPLGPRLSGSYRYYTFCYCCISHAPFPITVI